VGNEVLRKKMGEWGLKEAQKYSWDKISQRVLDFYEVCRKAKQS
jgi:glycosyltransferase involved in cell wall biosynthesis